MSIEKYMFRYIDAVNEQSFKEAATILKEILNMCDDESALIIEGFIDAASTLEALKYGDFDKVEELWNSYESKKEFINPKNRYYSIYLEMSLIVEDLKENIEKFI